MSEITLEFVSRSLDTIHSNMAEIRWRLQIASERLGGLESRMTALEARFSSLEARFAGLEHQFVRFEDSQNRTLTLLESINEKLTNGQ